MWPRARRLDRGDGYRRICLNLPFLKHRLHILLIQLLSKHQLQHLLQCLRLYPFLAPNLYPFLAPNLYLHPHPYLPLSLQRLEWTRVQKIDLLGLACLQGRHLLVNRTLFQSGQERIQLLNLDSRRGSSRRKRKERKRRIRRREGGLGVGKRRAPGMVRMRRRRRERMEDRLCPLKRRQNRRRRR